MKEKRIVGFIGAGVMAEAIIKNLVKTNTIEFSRLIVSDIDPKRRDFFQRMGLKAIQNNREVAKQSDAIVLAVKPQQVAAVLEDIKGELDHECVVISIAAGITTKLIEDAIGDMQVVRIMPNTPCMIGEGVIACAAGKHANQSTIHLVEEIFAGSGQVFFVEEKQMDAITGLSGSGPAYVYILIDALADGGVSMGLPKATALKLAAQTVLGAARMVQEMEQHPAQLKDMVTSPGGTTIAGIKELEKGSFRAVVMNAVEASSLKAAEIAKK
jgi:pyrroline-5-carboxylate reductase